MPGSPPTCRRAAAPTGRRDRDSPPSSTPRRGTSRRPMIQAPTLPDPLPLPARRRVSENGVVGVALFVFTEVMLFAGFISAFSIVRASAAPGSWPPPGQPRLPFERTAVNTAALLLSGVLLLIANRAYRAQRTADAKRWFGFSIVLGAFFVAFQGVEWVALLR